MSFEIVTGFRQVKYGEVVLNNCETRRSEQLSVVDTVGVSLYRRTSI